MPPLRSYTILPNFCTKEARIRRVFGRRVWNVAGDRIVVVPPGAEDRPCVVQGGEQHFVETFVAQPAVEASAERILLRLAGSDIAHHPPRYSGHRTRPALAHPKSLLGMNDRIPLGPGRHHFLAAISFNIALSSIASASNFFSLAFSSSSALSRLASDTSRPPNLDFHSP